jgi:hypothetical protein
MPRLEILCLANSSKRRGACIAGLRMDGGGWVRPVARTEHGELYPAHFVLADGGCPRIFDRILIPVAEARPAVHQPENWLIADAPWELVSRGLTAEAAALLEAHLVGGPALFGDFSHKVSFERLQTEPTSSSLCVIRPQGLQWAIEQLPYNAHKPYAQFRLGSRCYRLPVTDPVWLEAFRELPPGKHPLMACGIAEGQDVLLCISLGEPWEDGYCYKLVAAILPLDPPAKSDRPPMDMRVATWIIHALAAGIDPYTGEPLCGGGVLVDPNTIQALQLAEEAMLSRPRSMKTRELPTQAGKAWDSAEEELLLREFEAGESMTAIAVAHGRTQGAIRSRLIRLGKIEG